MESLLTVALLAGVCHLLYSHLGFSPTDEGYILSGSRRLLEGQVPHRDYLSLRPVGSHLLHAHLLLWAGDRLMWWSRLIAWIEFAVIAVCWMRIIGAAFPCFATLATRLAATFIAFAAAVHTFPMTPWNSIDGVLVLSLAVYCRRIPGWPLLAAFLAGSAGVFRQTFLLLLPFLFLAWGDLLKWRSWLAAFLLPGLYALWMLVTGGVHDCIIQVTGHGGQLTSALLGHIYIKYVLEHFPIQIGLGVLAGFLITRGRTPRLRALGSSTLIISVITCLLHMHLRMGLLMSWGILGMALGLAGWIAWENRDQGRVLFAACVVAWGSAVSLGWPAPSLGVSGILLAVLAIAARGLSTGDNTQSLHSRASLLMIAFALAVGVKFHQVRTDYIYFDMPRRFLTQRLDGVFPGGSGIQVNPRVHAYLVELKYWTDVAAQAGDTMPNRVAVLPEFPQFWVSFPQSNPLFYDWPRDEELQHPEVRARFLAEMRRLKGSTTFIVQRLDGLTLHMRIPFAYQPGGSVVRDLLAEEFTLVDEGPFFLVYI